MTKQYLVTENFLNLVKTESGFWSDRNDVFKQCEAILEAGPVSPDSWQQVTRIERESNNKTQWFLRQIEEAIKEFRSENG